MKNYKELLIEKIEINISKAIEDYIKHCEQFGIEKDDYEAMLFKILKKKGFYLSKGGY
jgi:hypothetical protein